MRKNTRIHVAQILLADRFPVLLLRRAKRIHVATFAETPKPSVRRSSSSGARRAPADFSTGGRHTRCLQELELLPPAVRGHADTAVHVRRHPVLIMHTDAHLPKNPNRQQLVVLIMHTNVTS